MFARHFSVVAGEGTVTVQARVLSGKSVETVVKSKGNSAEKVQRAVLYEQLNATKRRLIFRPTKAHLVNQFDLPQHNGKNLQPTQYLGVPSRADYTTIIADCDSAEGAQELVKTIEQCISYKTCALNIHPEHISALLRKSAEFGVFEHVYQYITSRSVFKRVLSPQVYLEALRIVALRVPSKSRDVKNLLFKLYSKSPEDVRREAVLLYGLSQYHEKANVDKQIAASLERLQGADLAQLDGVDAALATEAGAALDQKFDIKQEGDETTVYTVAI